MRILFAALLLGALVSLVHAQPAQLGTGLRVTGAVGSAGILRNDALAEYYGTDALVSLVATGIGNGTRQAGVMLGGPDGLGGYRKQATLTSVWSTTDAFGDVGVLRLNATYFAGGATENADAFLMGYGNKGAAFWGPVTWGSPPGYRVLAVNGVVYVKDGRDNFGTYKISARFENSAQDNGIQVGYDSAASKGVIGCSGQNCAIGFLGHNSVDGSTERMTLTKDGALTLKPIAGGTLANCSVNSFCNVGGALYWKGGAGTATQIAPQ